MKKLISIVIPCFNEEDNIEPISNAIISELSSLSKYNYEIIFIDNNSYDNTRQNLRNICKSNKHIKAIFNNNNFGQLNSTYHGMCQANGDCVILINCDFQEPPSMIKTFVKHWEEGYSIVCGVKSTSEENKVVYSLRNIYYELINKFSSIHQIKQFSGFALYDSSFINIMRQLNDPTPFLRGVVAEYGTNIKKVEFKQEKRKFGKTKYNLFSLYDFGVLSITTYTKVGIRLSLGFGIILFSLSFLLFVFNIFVRFMNYFNIIELFLFAIVFIFIGIIGEYIIAINIRSMRKPLVIEKERINF